MPRGYLDGEGHFSDWSKKRLDEKKRGPKTKKDKKKPGKNIMMLKKKMGKDKKDDSDVKPTHFDIAVFLKSFKRFVVCDGEQRSNARKLLLKDLNKSAKVFIDEHKELSFKKVVDVYELSHFLQKQGQNVDPTLLENLGSILMCFGEIEHELQYGERIPPETEDEKKARVIAEIKQKEMEDARREAEAAGEKFNEEDFKVPVIEMKKPVMMLLHLISITDLKFCCQKMFEFDKVLFEMGVQNFDVNEEISFMSMLSKKFKKKFYEEEVVHEMPPEPSTLYSENPEIQSIVEKIDDLTSVPEAPEFLQNAFAITLFCMEAAFDSRS